MKVIKVMKHALTAVQAAELKEHEIINLKDIDEKFATSLEQTPDNWEVLEELADKLIEICKDFDIAIMPVGSPAFWWILSRKWNIPTQAMFAHSVSNSVEKDVDEFVETEPGSGIFVKKKVVKKQTIFNHVRFF